MILSTQEQEYKRNCYLLSLDLLLYKLWSILFLHVYSSTHCLRNTNARVIIRIAFVYVRISHQINKLESILQIHDIAIKQR